MTLELSGDLVATCGDETIRLTGRDDAVHVEIDAPRGRVLWRLWTLKSTAGRITIPEPIRPSVERPLRVFARGWEIATVDTGGVRTLWGGVLGCLFGRSATAD